MQYAAGNLSAQKETAPPRTGSPRPQRNRVHVLMHTHMPATLSTSPCSRGHSTTHGRLADCLTDTLNTTASWMRHFGDLHLGLISSMLPAAGKLPRPQQGRAAAKEDTSRPLTALQTHTHQPSPASKHHAYCLCCDTCCCHMPATNLLPAPRHSTTYPMATATRSSGPPLICQVIGGLPGQLTTSPLPLLTSLTGPLRQQVA